MKKLVIALVLIVVIAAVAGAAVVFTSREQATVAIEHQYGPNPILPPPNPTILPTVNQAEARPWQPGEMPTPAEGFAVNQFAEGLDHPRWLHVLPNGDILVAESNKPPKEERSISIRRWVAEKVMGSAGANTPSANRISILRDADGDGVAEFQQPFITDLFSPFGITLLNGTLYVANADGIVAFPYEEGATEITVPPEKVVDLPAGLNHHWTKDVIASHDGTKLYATVGSNSNVGENGMDIEKGRAAVHEIDLATKQAASSRPASAIPTASREIRKRRAVGGCHERDEIGSDLVPDYMTSGQERRFLRMAVQLLRTKRSTIEWNGKIRNLVARAVKPNNRFAQKLLPRVNFKKGD